MNFNDAYFKTLNFVRSVDVLYTKQLETFCYKCGMTKLQKENTIKTLYKNKEIFMDEKGVFCSCKSDFKVSDFTIKLEKTLWFYVNNADVYSFVNFNPKPPATAYMCGVEDGEYKELTIFYIPTAQEKMESRIIETNYGGMPSPIPTALIFSDRCAIENVTLSNIFDIKTLAMIDGNGDIRYLTPINKRVE